MAVSVVCQACKKSFPVKPVFVRRGQAKFCSLACKYVGTRTGKMVSCFQCGREVYRKPRLLRLSKSKLFFCTKSCQTKWRNEFFVGPKHPNWKHGRSAYQSVLKRARRPALCEVCNTKDSRVLAVHHKDRNRLNNNLDNLAWLCHNCHFLVHHYDEGREKGLLRPRSVK